MPKHIVWVFGDSAAGKETFIRRFLGADQEMLTVIDFPKPAAASEYSISKIAQYPGDPITTERDKIISEAINLRDSHETILIKGQRIDLVMGHPRTLKIRLPKDIHTIVYLDAGVDETYRRVKQKEWFTPSITKDILAHWRWVQLAQLKELAEFKLLVFSSQAGENYRALKYLPKH